MELVSCISLRDKQTTSAVHLGIQLGFMLRLLPKVVSPFRSCYLELLPLSLCLLTVHPHTIRMLKRLVNADTGRVLTPVSFHHTSSR